MGAILTPNRSIEIVQQPGLVNTMRVLAYPKYRRDPATDRIGVWNDTTVVADGPDAFKCVENTFEAYFKRYADQPDFVEMRHVPAQDEPWDRAPNPVQLRRSLGAVRWINDEGDEAVFAPGPAHAGADVGDSAITWQDVYPGIDLRYTVVQDRLHKVFVVKTAITCPVAVRAGTNPRLVIDVSLQSSGAIVRLDGDLYTGARKTFHAAHLSDAERDSLRIRMPRPLALDSRVNDFNEVRGAVTVAKNGARSDATLEFPAAYFDDAVYPVFLDPDEVVISGTATWHDNRIESNNPTTNNGSSTYGQVSGSVDRAFLFDVDISALPSGSTIESAVFEFNCASTSGVDVTTQIYEMLRQDWNEGQSTWNQYKSGSNWTTAGCRSNGNDLTGIWSAPSGYKDYIYWPAARSVGDQVQSNGVAAYVQDRLDAAQSVLYFAMQTDSSSYVHFSSSEYGTAADRPQLIVTYTAPAGGGSAVPAGMMMGV